ENLHFYPDLIQKILKKIHKNKTIKSIKYYLLSWKEFDNSQRSWVSQDQISDKQLIQEY
ncbi:hypothetical protein PIROE2DRAFT_31576, partial [Piromyces sp. E2]